MVYIILKTLTIGLVIWGNLNLFVSKLKDIWFTSVKLPLNAFDNIITFGRNMGYFKNMTIFQRSNFKLTLQEVDGDLCDNAQKNLPSIFSAPSNTCDCTQSALLRL